VDEDEDFAAIAETEKEMRAVMLDAEKEMTTGRNGAASASSSSAATTTPHDDGDASAEEMKADEDEHDDGEVDVGGDVSPLSNELSAKEDVRVAVVGNVDSGKCWGPATKLMMYDGRVKSVEEIVRDSKSGIQQVLMGDDSTPRYVQAGSEIVGNTGRDAAALMHTHQQSNISLPAMYRITSINKGRDSWTCNGDHILVLKFNTRPSSVKRWPDDADNNRANCYYFHALELQHGGGMDGLVVHKTYTFPTEGAACRAQHAINSHWQPLIWECTVNEFLRCSSEVQELARMYQPDEGVDFPPLQRRHTLRSVLSRAMGKDWTVTKDQTLETAWVIGLWLASGIVRSDHIAQTKSIRSHPGVGDRLVHWYASVMGVGEAEAERSVHIRVSDKKTTSGHATSHIRLGPVFRRVLEKYNMSQKKCFPHRLLTESREVRMAVLAGIIDGGGSDSTFNHHVYEVAAKERHFINALIHLCRGLGLITSQVSQARCEDEETGEVNTASAYRIAIGGSHLATIATTLQHKRVHTMDVGVMHPDSDEHCDGFSVQKIGDGDYFGFQLDGNGRCLMADFTVTHNSTLIGVLTGGSLDDGRGKARSRVFIHAHEHGTGRTSAMSTHMFGFDAQGQPVHQTAAASAQSAAKTKSWAHVLEESQSTVTFIDLAGHEKYLRTTVQGLTGTRPDWAIVLINSLAGVTRMTKEHLGVVLALDIPLICVVTKVDLVPTNVLEQNKKQLFRILKSTAANKMPIQMRNDKDIETVITNSQNSTKVCPVFFISAVDGTHIPLLTRFLSRLRPHREWLTAFQQHFGHDVATNLGADHLPSQQHMVEYSVDETFSVTGIGVVVSGTVNSGTLHTNMQLLLGPFSDGTWMAVLVRSIHYKRVPVTMVGAGQSCAVSIRAVRRKDTLVRGRIRRGMVLVDPALQPKGTRWFEAEVYILHHATSIKLGYQAVLHCGMVRQTAQICRISNSSEMLRTNDKAHCRFRFLQREEYVHTGQPFVFREGNCKGIGRITRIQFSEEEIRSMEEEEKARRKQTGKNQTELTTQHTEEDETLTHTADATTAAAASNPPSSSSSGASAAPSSSSSSASSSSVRGKKDGKALAAASQTHQSHHKSTHAASSSNASSSVPVSSSSSSSSSSSLVAASAKQKQKWTKAEKDEYKQTKKTTNDHKQKS